MLTMEGINSNNLSLDQKLLIRAQLRVTKPEAVKKRRGTISIKNTQC
jgi:hypothetical protein